LLQGAEGDAAEVDALLEDFVARGWLSDARAALQLLHARSSRFGIARLIHELRLKGIAPELIEDALPGLMETELDRAQNVWQKKFGEKPHDAREKGRQMRFMQSRGFSLELILQVLRQVEIDGSIY
jgi:regulatory protein